MEINAEVQKSISKSVLCWLATVSSDNIPNVSPKEIFKYYEPNNIIVANIASPQTVKNINSNPNVCISFIDILLQKGYQIKGKAQIIKKTDVEFSKMEQVLNIMTEGKFPFSSVTKISAIQIKPIIAPKYILYPDTTEEEQIASAKNLYGI